ncbi:unnamed protein product [Discosporangium mesarthrocarpum]
MYPNVEEREPLADTVKKELSFKATYFYHERDGKPGSAYPWLSGIQIVEPHRETTMTVRQGGLEGMTYRWTITPADPKGEVIKAEGDGAVIVFKSLERNTVLLEEVSNETGEVVLWIEEDVMCKYVRREIRALLEEERQELFDAMRLMWELDTASGRKMYGAEYISAVDLGRFHVAAGASYECDHLHDGLGFTTSHVLITNIFERSLQLINPRLTMPYWDFTIDTSGKDTDMLKDCPLFQESWFGGFDSEDYQVKDGRWANWTIPDTTLGWQQEGLTDAYGRLRSPWSTNHRGALTRRFGDTCDGDLTSYKPLPECGNHYDLLTTFSTFYGFTWESMGRSHGALHIYLGGVIDCTEQYDRVAELVGDGVASTMRQTGSVSKKLLYRAGLLSCSADKANRPLNTFEQLFSTGVCGCHGLNLDTGDDFNQVFEAAGLDPDIIDPSNNEDTRRELARILCNTPANSGDHAQASSNLDPSFWPTHPTMERLWVYKVCPRTALCDC